MIPSPPRWMIFGYQSSPDEVMVGATEDIRSVGVTIIHPHTPIFVSEVDQGVHRIPIGGPVTDMSLSIGGIKFATGKTFQEAVTKLFAEWDPDAPDDPDNPNIPGMPEFPMPPKALLG